MKIVVIGTGFVGLTHAAVCAEMGHDVLAYDIDAARVAAYTSGERAVIEHYVNEPGLAACIARQRNRSLRFSTAPPDLAAALGAGRGARAAEAVFLCVPTPPQPSGATDRRHYLAAAHQVADALAVRRSSRRVVVVNKSTVPIGTARLLQGILSMRGAHHVGVASNPEFLPQGNALAASRHPDRIVVGADTEEDFRILQRVYDSSAGPRCRYIETTPETAEAIKYVANALLFTYISFWNGVGARLGERNGRIDMDALRAGVTADERISDWGAQVGIGAGGSCFGKDLRSLIHQLAADTGSAADCSMELLHAVHRINEQQKTGLVERAEREAGFSFEGKTVALLGLAFKQNTNDMRDSAALRAIDALLARGVAAIRAHDPVIDARAARRWLDPAREPGFARISYHGSVAEAVTGSDALLIATDWDEYRDIAGTIRGVLQPPYLILDGRRMLAGADDLIARGYDYLPVGGMLQGTRAQRRRAGASKSQAA